MEIECKICGKAFKTYPSHLERRKTCSRECASILKATYDSPTKGIKRPEMSGENHPRWVRIDRECLVCGETFSTTEYKDGKYCSRECYAKSLKGKRAHNYDQRTFVCENCGESFKESPSRIGKRKYCSVKCWEEVSWKGDEVGYIALHSWVQRHLGTPEKCEFCGKDRLIGHEIHWANKSNLYKRDLSDWIRLCAKCHYKYDNEMTGMRKIPWNKGKSYKIKKTL